MMLPRRPRALIRHAHGLLIGRALAVRIVDGDVRAVPAGEGALRGGGGALQVDFGLCPDSLRVDSFRLQAIQEATSEVPKITRQSLLRRSNL